jgi:hypothetical protein
VRARARAAREGGDANAVREEMRAGCMVGDQYRQQGANDAARLSQCPRKPCQNAPARRSRPILDRMALHARSHLIALATLAFAAQGAASRAVARSRAGLQPTPGHS